MTRSAKLGLSIAPLLAVMMAATGGLSKPERACVVAARWVTAHSGALPQTLKDLSTYSLAYRKAIYNKLPREVQLAMWHEQLRYYSQSSQFTGDQRAFIAEADAKLDQYFGPEHRDAAKAIYEVQAQAVLGFDQAKQVFATLGVNPPAEAQNLPADCECSTGSDWCNPFGPSCASDASCNTTDSGCGTLWCHSCNGSCSG